MTKVKNISILEQGIVSEMEKLQYAKETIRIFKLNCRKFREFTIKRQGNEIFDEKTGISYLSELYQYPPQELRPLTGTERNAVRCIRRLGEYNSYGSFTLLGGFNRVSIEEWGMKDTSIITSFIDGIQTPDNSQATKEYRFRLLHGFYAFISPHNITSVRELNASIISSYVLSLQGYASTTIQHRLATLKGYFRYVYTIGYCETDWSYSLPIIRKPKNLTVPALWTDEEILLMLKTIDRSSPMGKRDYAILLLVVQLGLRISDVSELKYSSFNWKTNTLSFIQKKTNKVNNSLPLTSDLGWAIIDYTKYGRPISELPYVFLSCNAPYRQMAPHSVGDIIRRAMQKAGIQKRKLVRSGMHSLRHALARRLLNENTPLSEIANIMGHANYESTSPYLKVDINGMRDCCLTLGGDSNAD